MSTGKRPDHGIAVLLELTRELTKQTPLEEALQAVTDAALELLPADHASIRVLEESRTELLCGARSGAGLPHRPLSFQPGQGVVGWVVQHRKAARIADAERDDRFESAGLQGWPIRSLLVVPLWSADRVVGALGVSSPQANAFRTEHEMMALLLGNCAAPPIERVRLERLSVTDGLTLAYNLRYFQPRLLEEMERAQRYGSSLSAVVLKLDDFERTTAQAGPEVGDRILRQLADRVRAAVRRSDALVRSDDAEFVLLMPHTDAGQAAVVGERIRRSLADHAMVVGDARFTVTTSMGAATWNRKESGSQLEGRAKQALSQAGLEGGGCMVVASTPPPASVEPPAHS